jgi:hypothetical protein
MAMPRRIKVEFGEVFEHGLFMVGEVEPLKDFEKSTRERPVLAVDEDSGLPICTVDVIDADPQATKSTRSLSVRIVARVQPVPPESSMAGPFRPVGFEGLTALPYIDDNGNFSRIVWSYWATGFADPVTGGAVKPQLSSSNRPAA